MNYWDLTRSNAWIYSSYQSVLHAWVSKGECQENLYWRVGFFHWSFDLHRLFDKTLPSCFHDRVRGLHSLGVNLPPTFSQTKVGMTRKLLFRVLFIEPFHMTSQRPYWCSKTKKRWPCWCTKLNPWEVSFIFVQIFSFCGVKLTWPLVT